MPDYYQCIIREGEERRKKIMKKETISTRLKPQVVKIIHENAKEREIFVSDWFKHAILEELKRQGLTGKKFEWNNKEGKYDISTDAQESNPQTD